MAGWIWKTAPPAAVATVVALAFVASVPAATNLIANGTFEGSGSGSLSGWGGERRDDRPGGRRRRRPCRPRGRVDGRAQAYAYTSSKPVKSVDRGYRLHP